MLFVIEKFLKCSWKTFHAFILDFHELKNVFFKLWKNLLIPIKIYIGLKLELINQKTLKVTDDEY